MSTSLQAKLQVWAFSSPWVRLAARRPIRASVDVTTTRSSLPKVSSLSSTTDLSITTITVALLANRPPTPSPFGTTESLVVMLALGVGESKIHGGRAILGPLPIDPLMYDGPSRFQTTLLHRASERVVRRSLPWAGPLSPFLRHVQFQPSSLLSASQAFDVRRPYGAVRLTFVPSDSDDVAAALSSNAQRSTRRAPGGLPKPLRAPERSSLLLTSY